MTIFDRSAAPTTSIWGRPQSCDQVLPGIWHVTTASHGGLILSEQRQAAMPDALRGNNTSYEEDVDWALVYVAFAGEFSALRKPRYAFAVSLAHASLKAWRPTEYATYTGKPVAVRDSIVLQRIDAYKACIGEMVVVSAYGDWADWVPAGMTGVVGRRLTGVSHTGFAEYQPQSDVKAICSAERYDSRRLVNSFAQIGAVAC